MMGVQLKLSLLIPSQPPPNQVPHRSLRHQDLKIKVSHQEFCLPAPKSFWSVAERRKKGGSFNRKVFELFLFDSVRIAWSKLTFPSLSHCPFVKQSLSCPLCTQQLSDLQFSPLGLLFSLNVSHLPWFLWNWVREEHTPLISEQAVGSNWRKGIGRFQRYISSSIDRECLPPTLSKQLHSPDSKVDYRSNRKTTLENLECE